MLYMFAFHIVVQLVVNMAIFRFSDRDYENVLRGVDRHGHTPECASRVLGLC